MGQETDKPKRIRKMERKGTRVNAICGSTPSRGTIPLNDLRTPRIGTMETRRNSLWLAAEI